MAEFAANNAQNESTGTSPFLANYGQHPRMGFEPPAKSSTTSTQYSQTITAEQFVANMTELNEYLREEMAWAQAVYADKADRTRNPAPAYRVGDLIWLNL
jgi:hypothetical protein